MFARHGDARAEGQTEGASADDNPMSMSLYRSTRRAHCSHIFTVEIGQSSTTDLASPMVQDAEYAVVSAGSGGRECASCF